MRSLLVLFHVESNTGYAIGRLESIFFEMARQLCSGDLRRIHFSYPSMAKGRPQTLPANFDNYTVIDPLDASTDSARRVKDYLRTHDIDTVFGFDQPVSRPLYGHLRAGGVRHFISYWGAPMSSVFRPFKRLLKRIEVSFKRSGPDYYIFESQGMAETATHGRGIPARKVAVVYLGVDSDTFRPDARDHQVVFDTFGIPSGRRVFFYSGHMESRKGVQVIVDAARHLAEHRRSDDWHIVLVGNKNSEAEIYQQSIRGHKASSHVTFGGYHNNIEQLHRGCYAGIIASTGWDSLTCSSMEMQSSGLPLLLSDLTGLREAIAPDESGLLFTVGNPTSLAQAMIRLLDDTTLRDRLSAGARSRITRSFTLRHQTENLVSAVRAATRN